MKAPLLVKLARMVIAFAVVLSLGLIKSEPVQAGGGGILVTTLTDAADLNFTDGICDSGGGKCSLRAAIQEANYRAGMQSIYFDWTVGVDGVKTYSLTLGEISINDTIEISGNGIYTVIDGLNTHRIFNIPNATADVTIRNVKLVFGKESGHDGGAINSNANLKIDGCIFENNQAVDGGKGGAIFNTGPLKIRNSLFKSNTASTAGAIFHTTGNNLNALNQVINSTFENNAAIAGAGGAVTIYSHLNFDGVMFRNNHDQYGGGALRFIEAGTVDNSTFYQNTTQSGGGAIQVTTAQPVMITNSTFYQNASVSQGGAISISDTSPNVRMFNLTVAGNQASAGGIFAGSNAVLVNSILSGNLDGLGQPSNCKYQKTTVHFAPSTGNLSDDATCAFSGPGDQNNVSMALGALLNNGGPVPTLALLPTSPAIAAATGDQCPQTDARGIRRLADGSCDSGAYEHLVSVAPPGCKPVQRMASLILRDPLVIAPGATSSVSVQVNSLDPYIWDLNVVTLIETPKTENLRMELHSPEGSSILLTDGNGDDPFLPGLSNIFYSTLWDDQALAPVAAQTLYLNSLTATPLSPQTTLGKVTGQDPNGSWELSVANHGVPVKDQDFVLRGVRLIFTLCQGTLVEDPGVATFLWTGSTDLPDLGARTVTIDVPVNAYSLSRRILAMNITTSITHAWTSDLSAWLTSPSGTTVPVTLRNGAGMDNLYNGTTWVNFAAYSPVEYPYANVPVAQLAPQVSFSAFAGEKPGGTWTLTLRDAQAGYPGNITRFSITFVTVPDYPLYLPLLNQ